MITTTDSAVSVPFLWSIRTELCAMLRRVTDHAFAQEWSLFLNTLVAETCQTGALFHHRWFRPPLICVVSGASGSEVLVGRELLEVELVPFAAVIGH